MADLLLNDKETNSGTRFTWDEQAEIRFVLEHANDIEGNYNQRRRMRLHLPTRQRLRARHVPGLLYLPAIFLDWYAFQTITLSLLGNSPRLKI
jgi:hypothetical protein